jgi:hypothetical protein
VQSKERGGEDVGPAPGSVDLEPDAAAAAHEAGGDVQQPVAQRLRFGLGQRGIVVEQDGLRPRDEVDGGQRAGQPGLVDRESFGRELAEAGVLAASDAVFDAGVGAVPRVEPGVLPDRGVGGEAGVAPAVAFFDQVELGAGVGAFRRTMMRIPAG